MKNTISILLFTLSLIGLLSCGKNRDDMTGTKLPVYIDAEFKSHFVYKPGTYWVFHDTVSGHTDSMVVSNWRTYAPYEGANRSDANQEVTRYNLVLYDQTVDSLLTTWDIEILAPSTMTAILPVSIGIISCGLVSGNPIDTGILNSNHYCHQLSSYSDYGNTYSNVYKIGSKYMPYFDNIICMTNDRGFIQMEINTDTTPVRSLHLLRYHITN